MVIADCLILIECEVERERQNVRDNPRDDTQYHEQHGDFGTFAWWGFIPELPCMVGFYCKSKNKLYKHFYIYFILFGCPFQPYNT